MLRIGVYFENRLGRNDGNPIYVTAALKRLEYYGALLQGKPEKKELLSWFSIFPDPYAEKLAKTIFEKYGEAIEADHFIPHGDLAPYGTYDLNLHIDWGEDALTSILPYVPLATPRPFGYWASDTHINNGTEGDSYPYRMQMAKKADFAFVAQKRGLEQMKLDGVVNPIWLPHAVEPQAYPKIDVATKRYDVCFVGNINSGNRVEAVDRLFREFPNFYYGQQLFENAAQKYAESKVCFNIAMTDDLNMRNFEVMASGSMLLTSWIPTIEEFFEDGKHLVLYRSLDEMVDKAKYYVDHDTEREKIAQAGYEAVIANHKIMDRVGLMLETFLKSRVLVA